MSLIELISAIFAVVIGVVSMISSVVHVFYGKKTYNELCRFCKSSDCKNDCVTDDEKFQYYTTHYFDYLSDLYSKKIDPALATRVFTYYRDSFEKGKGGLI